MDKLAELRDVVHQVYADMLNDPRTDLVLAMGKLFPKPLVRFDEAYNEFVLAFTKDSAIFDRWVNVQMQVLTMLGADAEPALKQFMQTLDVVFDDTPGGDTATYEAEDKTKKSFVITLAFRVYLDALVSKTIADQEAEAK